MVGHKEACGAEQIDRFVEFQSGLRAKEIANLRWEMVMGANGEIADTLALVNGASKGKSGRIIALNKEVITSLIVVKGENGIKKEDAHTFVVRAQRADRTSAQASEYVRGMASKIGVRWL